MKGDRDMNARPNSGSVPPAPRPLCPIPRSGVQGPSGILLYLLLLLSAATVGIGICAMRTTSEPEVQIAEGISAVALLLLTVYLWKVTRTARMIVPILAIAGVFLVYLTNSLIPTAVLVSLIFAVSEGSFLVAVQPKNKLAVLLTLPVLAYAATLLLSRDPAGSVAALIPFPAIPVLAWGTRRSAASEDGITRVGVICATSLALGLSLGGMILFSVYRYVGSLDPATLTEALEAFRENLILQITSTEFPTEGMTPEQIAEIREMLSYANVSNTVDSCFNVLPGIAVVAVNLLAAVVQIIQHASLRAFGFEASITDRVKAFRMSLLSCIAFLAAYLIAMLEDTAVTTLAGTVAQNIYIILMPGLALAGMLRLTSGLVSKGPQKLGCLFYFVFLIPCFVLFAPFVFAAIEVISHIFTSVTSAIKPPEDPDDPFGGPPEGF